MITVIAGWIHFVEFVLFGRGGERPNFTPAHAAFGATRAGLLRRLARVIRQLGQCSGS